MHALKTLDILRPSRPASPAPPSTQVTHSTANGTTQQPIPTVGANGELKNRSRSLSRQLTDKVAGLHLNTGVPVVTSSVVSPETMNGKKEISPPTSRAPTPRIPPTTLPVDTAPGAAYMDVLGLRLAEAVNKASAGVDYKTKKGFKKGNGWSVGEVVVKELPYPPNDAYLIRAVLRTSVRSLSIYITRLESLLLPALTDPSFIHPLNLHPGALSNPLNPAQYYAISIAHAAWETCEVLEQTLDTGNWPKYVNESLRPVMDKLDLVVGKVTQPLLISLKRDLIASLAKTDSASPPGGKVLGLATIPNPTIPGSDVPIKKEVSHQPVGRLVKEPSQSGMARSLAIPVALQHFASKIDAAKKVLDLVAVPCADDGEAWITNVVVAVVWKGMCVMAEKDAAAAGRPPSPTSVSRALNNLGKESTPAVVSDRMAPSLAKLATNPLSILPSRSASRAPSPPRASRVDPDTHALMSLEGLVKRLVGGLVPPPLSPDMTPDPNATEHLAREALHEALEALTSLRIVTSSMNGQGSSGRTLASLRRIRDDVDDLAEEALDDAWEDLPAITVFTILSRQANLSLSSLPIGDLSEKHSNGIERLRLRTAYEVWGWTKVEYERQVLGGFGAAEEWGRRVAQAYKGEVERVLGELIRLQAGHGEKPGREVMEAMEWTRAVGVALEARAGVKFAMA